MKIRYLGHSGLHIELAGLQLVVDPFISGNEMASDIDISQLKPDYLLLTHGHQDHTLDAEKILKQCDAKLISTYEVATHYGNKGYDVVAMNHGGVYKMGELSLKMVNAVHSSSYADGSYAGNPVGLVLYTETECVYISGDTALTMDMKLIPMTCPPVDLAVLCIGDHFTMGYKDAVIAAQFVEAKIVLGVHYDTFPPIKMDKEAAIQVFTEAMIRLDLPAIGEEKEY